MSIAKDTRSIAEKAVEALLYADVRELTGDRRVRAYRDVVAYVEANAVRRERRRVREAIKDRRAWHMALRRNLVDESRREDTPQFKRDALAHSIGHHEQAVDTLNILLRAIRPARRKRTDDNGRGQ